MRFHRRRSVKNLREDSAIIRYDFVEKTISDYLVIILDELVTIIAICLN